MMKEYNSILANFEFLVDLDLAMYRLIKDKYKDTPFVDKEFINEKDQNVVVYRLLNRQPINPLEIILPEYDTLSMYYELQDKHYEELLSYATVYDTFPLLITFLNEASSIEITVRCKNKIEENFIKKLNKRLNTVIIPERKAVNLNDYSIIYEKYYANLIQYRNLDGKHIYIAAARFNMEPDQDYPNIVLSKLFSDVNIIHLMDLYQYVKFRYKIKEDENT